MSGYFSTLQKKVLFVTCFLKFEFNIVATKKAVSRKRQKESMTSFTVLTEIL